MPKVGHHSYLHTAASLAPHRRVRFVAYYNQIERSERAALNIDFPLVWTAKSMRREEARHSALGLKTNRTTRDINVPGISSAAAAYSDVFANPHREGLIFLMIAPSCCGRG